MTNLMKFFITLDLLAIVLVIASCSRQTCEEISDSHTVLFEDGRYPNVTEHNGTYYFIMQSPPPNSIGIRSSESLEEIGQSEPVLIWEGTDKGMLNVWSPELSRIGDKWYVYFEADNGNTDNHQLYVLENSSGNPMEGEWKLHGPIITNNDWNYGIHPSTIVAGGRQYLLWSGWPQRRAETETQCIFIAEMENPWTLKSERIMLSRPEYEWERQWVNPDGTRTAYPIFVNENPEAFLSPDNEKVIVVYSASGIWTPYNSLGMLYAPVGSDLLDASSWTKMPEPIFKAPNEDATMFGTSNVSVVTGSDGVSRLIYQAKSYADGIERSSVLLKTIGWDDESLPVFGSPR